MAEYIALIDEDAENIESMRAAATSIADWAIDDANRKGQHGSAAAVDAVQTNHNAANADVAIGVAVNHGAKQTPGPHESEPEDELANQTDVKCPPDAAFTAWRLGTFSVSKRRQKLPKR